MRRTVSSALPQVLRRSARGLSSEALARPSAAALKEAQKLSLMQRDLISDEETKIKNFTLNFGPQASGAREPLAAAGLRLRGAEPPALTSPHLPAAPCGARRAALGA